MRDLGPWIFTDSHPQETPPMYRKPTAALGIALGALTLAPATASADTPDTCVVTAQPWNAHTYALAAVVDGEVVHLITAQDGGRLDPTSWSFPEGSLEEVWWAAKDPQHQTAAHHFHDVLPVGPGCVFTVAYKGEHGKPDSVVIRRVPGATTTTSTQATTTTSTTAQEATTTTSTVPSTTTTTEALPGPSTTVSEGTTTTVQAVAPTTVVAVPSTSTSPPTTQVAPTTVQDETTTSTFATPVVTEDRLPVTGAVWLRTLLVSGPAAMALGGLFVALRRHLGVTK